jgi:hypothetical protein
MPCGRVYWQGHVHRKPEISIDADGVPSACSDFQPQPSEATA